MGLDHPWTEPPRPGTVVDVLPGIKWLRMPLPFRLDHINLWLLEDGAGWTAVDTGIGLEETRALWERVFTETLGEHALPQGARLLARKSTRLNSSHDQISYAVSSLNKKKALSRRCSP